MRCMLTDKMPIFSYRRIKKLQSQSGQTVIEVLIATMAVSMVMITVMSSMVLSIVNTTQSRQQSAAATLAQEPIEVLRRERARLGWQIFYDALPETTYCLNALPETSEDFLALSSTSAGGCGDTINDGGFIYSREMTITKPVGTEIMEVSVYVEWLKAGGETTSLSVQQTLQDIDSGGI